MSNEADTCRKYVLPNLYAAGWTDDQIGEQKTITAGRILVQGRQARRGPPKRADYLLRYKHDYPLAVIEAKADYHHPAEGMQQAKAYAEMLGLLFAYATNGKGIVEYDFSTGQERGLDAFPGPRELWNRQRAARGLDEALDDQLLVPYESSERGKEPRYYQQIAINRAVEAILKGQRRVLLTLATGTGKTLIAFQIAWKLWAGYWNVKGQPHHRPRILFLADRTVLVDDPKDKTFTPFGDARIKIEHGNAVKSREIYFATYQAIAKDDYRPGLYREYPPDFFDLVIVDEAHRGSARDDSSWREILEYFTGAVQLGMTATPLREDNRDTYEYFGHPVYIYSLKQGIQDGFLAPYQVRRVVIDIDTTGFRPFAGQVDDYGEEVPDREYGPEDFERVLSLKARSEAVAQHLTNYLKKTDRQAKTVIFCVDQEHALHMRQALINANADMLRQFPNYVVRITANEGETGKGFLSAFQDIDKEIPVIVTTSRLLSTGVDMPTVKNVVLFRIIKSMPEFKQIIGRGTRVREDYGKLFFTILDYTGSATHAFADPEFDGEPVRIDQETTDAEGNVQQSEVIEVAEESPEYKAGLANLKWDDDEPQKRQKYYLSEGVQVGISHEMEMQLDAGGKRLQMVKLSQYAGEQVRSLYPTAEAMRSQWTRSDSRNQLIQSLEDKGISLEALAVVLEQPDADPFDLLCHLAFNAPLRTRRERADTLRKERRAFFERYSPEARAILEDILNQYAEYGPAEIAMPDVLKLPPILKYGTVVEIAHRFGGPDKLREAVNQLQTLLYAA